MDNTAYYRRIAHERSSSVTARGLRILAVAAALAAWVWQSQLNEVLAGVWEMLKLQWWFQHDTFEPTLSTVAFFPPLVFFYVLDSMEISKQYRVRPTSNDMSAWKTVPLSDLFKDPTKSRVPVLLAYILPLVVIDWLYPRRVLHHAAPTVFQLVGELISMLVVYDGLFWGVHRVMHSSETLYRVVHAKHHENADATRANDAVRLSFLEEFFDVSCSIIAVNITKSHPMSRALYDCVIVYLLVEAHCGLDMPWMAHNVCPGGLMGGPRRHDMHHASGRHYHQKFFTYLDDLVGPLEHDTGAVRLYGNKTHPKHAQQIPACEAVPLQFSKYFGEVKGA